MKERHTLAMPQPGPQHAVFTTMVGVWEGQDKMHPSPWMPEGATVDARAVNRIGTGGFTVIQDYAQLTGGRPSFEGHGVLSWDDANQNYVMHWWDSMGQAPNVFTGTFENGRLSMIGPGMGGQTRVTWNFETAGSYTFLMEVSPDGAQWFPSMEGTYRKTV